MIGSIERIAQDIAALNTAVAELADEFHSTYSSYLNALAQAVRQQLVLVSYHVCTQGYPEQFLHLSYSQRQQLQKNLRHLAEQVQEELLAQLHVPVVLTDTPDGLDSAHLIAQTDGVETGLALSEAERSVLQEHTSDKSAPTLTPTHLARWQQDLEQAINEELRTASHAANRLMQQANILPKKLPDTLLEAASKAEMAEGGTTPNLLTLLIDAGTEELPEKGQPDNAKGHLVMQIVAVHLRLSDIEFAEATLTATRTKIRSLSAQLKTLGREYQKKERERAIAEAQAAWRLTWVDE